jgi:BlaR1 peptidase M56
VIALDMLHALLVGALVAVACWLLERAARATGVPTRGVWAAGMVAMLALGGRVPLARLSASPVHSRIASPMLGHGGARASKHAEVPSGTPSSSDARLNLSLTEQVGRWEASLVAFGRALARWDDLLLGGWALLTAFFGGIALHAALEGRRLRHGLEPRVVAGTPVLVGDHVGPCAVGTRAPAILLPRWTLGLSDAEQRMVVRHEREHLRARDPLLLLIALIAVVLAPWQLALWWAWNRLRLAVEVDCDRRVLREHHDVREYAQLLLLTTKRLTPVPWSGRAVVTVVTPLRPHAHQLAQRILAMTEPQTARTPLRAALATTAAATALTLAFTLPAPRVAAAQAGNGAAGRVDGGPAGGVVGRVILRVSDVGLKAEGDPTAAPRVILYTTRRATLGVAGAARRLATDTVRIDRVPAFTADVTEGDVHVELLSPGRLMLRGEISGGPAEKLTAEGRHVMFLQGGAGVRVLDSLTRTGAMEGSYRYDVGTRVTQTDSASRALIVRMRADLSALRAAQDAYFAAHATYAPGLETLEPFHGRSGATVTIVEASSTGWLAVVTHPALPGSALRATVTRTAM